MKIRVILDKIDEGQLFVPAFQREYVWKRDNAKLLVESLIKEYPTGTMLTWETSNPPELKGPHEYSEKQGAIKLLLDGQQRITTLYMLIRGELPPYYTKPEITNDTRGLHVNVETLELLYYQRSRMENEPRWCDITEIFNRKIRPRDIIRLIEQREGEASRELEDRIDDNMRAIENIVEREFPEQIIPINATISEAIDIFYKVNASGVSLTDAELALAQISGYWPEARDLFKAKLSKLAAEGFIFKLDFVVYALLGCVHHVGSDMRKLHDASNKHAIQKAWSLLDTHVLDYVANLMRSRAYVDHTTEINSIYALIPIIVFFHDRHGEKTPDDQLWRIIRWFYYSQIRTRYVSQLPQKLDADLRTLTESDRPFELLLGVATDEGRLLRIRPDEFVGRSVSHPLFGLMRWFLKSQGAICFTTGLRIHNNMGEKYQLENDHIFPSARLRDAGYARGNRLKYALAQELTNRAILTQTANRKKSATASVEYLTTIAESSPGALEKQCIPTNPELWSVDRYEDFLQERRVILARGMNQYLDGLTNSADDEIGETSILELIDEGESEELEFKSSMRWDYRQGTVNKKLEEVIVKTVAAFANSDGGTLMIGVDDDGVILGLDNDYQSLKGDRDRFELHLRNLLNEKLGKGFVAQSVEASFPTLEQSEICVIDIGMSNSPLTIKTKTDGGAPQERFYVRSGNSSQELSIQDYEAYRRDRFA